MDKEILVVIPYLASAAQGNELELAIAGWRRFFKEPHRIVIVGDCPSFAKGLLQVDSSLITTDLDPDAFAEEWLKHNGQSVFFCEKRAADFIKLDSSITFIPCRRVAPLPGQYRPHLDHVHKFRTVREQFPESEGFIYTCDDIYPTAPFTMEDVLQPKEPELGFFFKPFDWRKGKVDWYSDKGKTGELCRRVGLPPRNWVCHLPVYYEWEKLLAIYDKYDCDHVSYIVENIYFNMKYPDDPHAVSERIYHDEVKTSNPDIRPLGSVKWVSNANSGWSERLEKLLREYYSQF